MSALRSIPKVDRLLADPAVQQLQAAHPRTLLLKTVRSVLAALRKEISAGGVTVEMPLIVARIASELAAAAAPSLRRVINATGTVIHTNLGRSPLPPGLFAHLADTACHYSTLEYDTTAAERGDRHCHVEPLICELTGAEAALVVNNNAAALLLALSTLASDREVIVSRGELVEIGGSFRIPDILLQSGARLREVGTTNRTHLRDYRQAITGDTALLLKVSCSNFAMVGFTAEVSVNELVQLRAETAVPLMVDAGSGCFIDLEPVIGCHETTVRQYLAAGADLVVCSGDKLLGGPQAGIIAGKRSLLEPMKKHPLLRALRLDKMTLAVLEGVLRICRDERAALQQIPTLRMLSIPFAELDARAGQMLAVLLRAVAEGIQLELVDGYSLAGGGALPGLQLRTRLIAVKSANITPEQLDFLLRTAAPPVIGRIAKGVFLLDTRTILDDDVALLAAVLAEL
jgi:L-seryl-tRNA(Ser) seleniumtransferase